jgi:hypothetical protein
VYVPASFHPGFSGQIVIEDDQIVLLDMDELESLFAGTGLVDIVALRIERRPHDAPDLRVVVHD